MIPIIIKILLALLVFGALIFIHELGHFLTARAFDVAIREFALGMGPKIVSHKSKKSGIVYSLRLLPIGGYVSMVGEDEESDDERALCKKAVWKRMIITIAGAAMNIILGIILMSTTVIQSEAIGSTTIRRFTEAEALSQKSGLEIGDRIIKIDGSRVHVWSDLVYAITLDASEPVDVTVIRDGKRLTLEDVEFPTEISEGIKFGIPDFRPTLEDKTPLNVIKHSFFQSTGSIKMIWNSFIDLVTGKYGIDAMSGPVGVTDAIGEAAESGSADFIYFCALITLNLGIFNLLPLPALDGGRLVFQIVELIRRKPIKPEYEGYIHFVGIVLLMLLMIIITYKDIVKIFIK